MHINRLKKKIKSNLKLGRTPCNLWNKTIIFQNKTKWITSEIKALHLTQRMVSSSIGTIYHNILKPVDWQSASKWHGLFLSLSIFPLKFAEQTECVSAINVILGENRAQISFVFLEMIHSCSSKYCTSTDGETKFSFIILMNS